jgi:hypothetical protein
MFLPNISTEDTKMFLPNISTEEKIKTLYFEKL